MNMSEDLYKYFRIEAREILAALGKELLRVEREGSSREAIGQLLRLAHTLKGAARVVKQFAIAEMAHTLEEHLAVHREGTPVSKERLEAMLHLVDAMTAQVVGQTSTVQRTETVTVHDSGYGELPETVRVEIEHADRLLEGLTEASAQLHALSREIEAIEQSRRMVTRWIDQLSGQRHTDPATVLARAHTLANDVSSALARAHYTLERQVSQLRNEFVQLWEAASSVRLIPARTIFPSLERAARDAARALDKTVEWGATGGDVRVDAHVLWAVRDALIHVVRNAVAHGIEPKAERRAAGKSETGRVALRVEHKGSKVGFVCQDDGRGIDIEAVRRAAVQRGMLSSTEAAVAGLEDLVPLLLRGLSTSREVSEVAGRGIGLDVLRDIAERLKGSVRIDSEPGRGTSVEIWTPVSLSSLLVLAVQAGGVSALVPLEAVRQTLRLPVQRIVRSGDRESIVCDGEVIPFLPLAFLLGQRVGSVRDRRYWQVVVVHSHRAVALGIDRLSGVRTAVVRSLPPLVAAERVVSGTALDVEGVPQLVLDPDELVSAVLSFRRPEASETEPSRPRILVIDDSLTTRMLEQSILESAGYQVDLASSAEEALAKARDQRYALFLVDVEMPGMDGFEFVARTRADPVLQHVPAILVTSRASADDRERGERVGAKGYMVKSEFDQDVFLQTVRDLVGPS